MCECFEWEDGDIYLCELCAVLLADAMREIKEKCEQYWNERGIGDSEFHAILDFIHDRASRYARGVTAEGGA